MSQKMREKKKNPRVWVTTVETKEVGMVDGLYFRIRVPGFMTISLRINMHHKNIYCTGGVHTTPPQVAHQREPLTGEGGRGEGRRLV